MLSTSFCRKITDFFNKRPGLKPILKLLSILLTGIGYISYPVLILFIYFFNRQYTLLYILGPALCFLGLSLIRKKLAWQRPYEVYDIDPIIGRKKTGDSFPSRHVFSMSMIGILYIKYFPIIAFLLLICTFFMALIRVISLIHFPRDVVFGALIGIICGAVIISI